MNINSIRFVLFIVALSFSFNVLSQTVYTTKTGEKYHKNNCRYLKYSKKQTTIDKAKAIGYVACKVCKPTLQNTKSITANSLTNNSNKKVTSKKTTATQCTGKTKKGSRCKRKTKNSNGRCYQH